VATQIGTLSDWTEVALGGSHTCGISASKGVLCWGQNDRHQAAPSSGSNTIAMPTPIALPNSLVALHVFTGNQITCVTASTDATAQAGQLWCWGRNDQEVPSTGTNDLAVPTQIGSAADWTSFRGNALF